MTGFYYLTGQQGVLKNMDETKPKIRNSSIDIFRCICAIMVVAIHTNPFTDVSEGLGFVFTQVLTRVAVPFFFAAAGYFYIQKLEKGQKPFFAYMKRLLTTYLIWSCFYFLIDFIQWGHTDFKDFVLSSAYKFAVTGSSYQFWFFPALIFSVCFTTFLFRIKCRKIVIPLSIVLYIIGCLGCSYYELGIQIPILGNLFALSGFETIRRVFLMGLPYFVSGYLVYKLQSKTENRISNKKLLFIRLGCAVIWLTEIGIVKGLKIADNIVITFGLYLLVVVTLAVLLRNPLPKFRSLSSACRVIANFTFYSHPFFIMCLSDFADNILNKTVTQTPMFLITVCLTAIGGLMIYKLNNKFLNALVK